jgi:hypothetical protein
MNHGLRELPIDERDFKLGQVFDLPTLEELPVSFKFQTLGIKDQKGSDFCTAFAYCTLSELQEEVELEPSWSFAMTKMIEGDHTSYGADLRIAAKAHTAYGALPADQSPYDLNNKEPDFLRNPEVWDYRLAEKAEPHKKKSFFKVTGPYDAFDNIRASIWKFREKKQGVAIGVIYGWSTHTVHVFEPSNTGGGHAMAVVGWDGDFLVVQNSYGLDSGEQGYQYLHRSVINANVERYGAFMLVDIDRTEAEFLIDNGIKADWTLIKQFFQLIINWFKNL